MDSPHIITQATLLNTTDTNTWNGEIIVEKAS